MSRVITIAGIVLLLASVFVGVLVAVAEAPKEPPTELYVRTTPPGAKLLSVQKDLCPRRGRADKQQRLRRL